MSHSPQSGAPSPTPKFKTILYFIHAHSPIIDSCPESEAKEKLTKAINHLHYSQQELRITKHHLTVNFYAEILYVEQTNKL